MLDFYAIWHDGDPGTWPSVTWIGRFDGEGEEIGEECDRLMTRDPAPLAILDEEQMLFLARGILGEVYAPWDEKQWDRMYVPVEERELYARRGRKVRRLTPEQEARREPELI